MFKRCLSKFSCALVMMCALVTGGLLQSCDDVLDLDEYKYDDSEPSWLGPSIYEFLKTGNAGHTYNNYVKLIEELDQKEILSRTGSRTMFIADDAAFERFFGSDNVWGVKSYEDLTYRQKKVLLNNVMLKNAYLLDMLAMTSVDPNSEPSGGDCLRRETMATLYDSVPLFKVVAETNALSFPKNNESFKYFEDYLATSGKEGVRVALGSENPMMVHFLYEYVRTKNILDSDFSVMFQRAGKTRTGTEAFVFSNKILNSDVSYGDLSDDTLTITCKNGYLYRMDDVLVPPSNMAQVLRETENTKLFSRMLDRFAYLEYSKPISTDYNSYEHDGKPEDNENVYLLKYALLTKEGSDIVGQPFYTPDANGLAGKDYSPGSKEKRFGPDDYVKFDPGNAQYDGGQGLRGDMAAILVPNDEMVYRFFAPKRYQDKSVLNSAEAQSRSYGVGSSIVEQFAAPADLEKLQEVPGMDYYEAMQPCLDSVPLKILSAFVNNLMQESFLSTLPSNFERVRNDARDEMGLKPEDVEDCVVANNGIIYILNNVYGPARYQAVMTPPLVMSNMQIMNAMIANYKYDSYLLAMDATYSFIVPDDTCFVYYDPATFKSKNPTAYAFSWGKVREAETNPGLICTEWKFDPATYQLTEMLKEPVKTSVSNYKNKLQDLMEYFIIIDSIESPDNKLMNEYYLTKGYGIVKCTKDEAGNVRFQGGEQLEISRLLGRDVYVTVTEHGRFEEKNGVTYCTESNDENYKSGVVSPPTKTIYSYVSAETPDNPFYAFSELCEPLSDDTIYKKVFNIDDSKVAGKNQLSDSVKKYSIFSSKLKSFDRAVSFLSTYHYTVYVPQPSEIQKAIELGLPTKEDIEAEIAAENYGRAASMVRLLNKYLRYYFQDNAVLVDKLPFRAQVSDSIYADAARYETAIVNEKTGRFFDLLVKSDGGTITITDDQKNVAKVMNKPGEEGKTWNVLARDIQFSADVTSPTFQGKANIETSAFAVIHQIDKALYNSNVIGYDGRFNRFGKDGELVDKAQIPVPVSYDEATDKVVYNNAEYLLGKSTSYLVETDNGRRRMSTGYLMKENGSIGRYEREEYVLLGDTAKILITDAGHLIGLDTLVTGVIQPRYLWADMKPLSFNAQGTVHPDSIVTVLPNGTFVDGKGKVIK